MHAVDSRPDYQGDERRLQGDRAGGGTVEYSYQPPETTAHDSHQASKCAAWVMSGLGDRYRCPRGQADPTAFHHEEGGPL